MGINLDTARRERETPEGLPVTLGGTTFMLPAEFPIDVLDPFLSDEFDLAGLIRDALELAKNPDGTTKPIEKIVVDVLFTRPQIPVEVLAATREALGILFGADNWALFLQQRPSLPDFAVLVPGLFDAYGTSLGEAFASPASSTSGGTTPSLTSSASTDSTPAPSGDGQVTSTDSSV